MLEHTPPKVTTSAKVKVQNFEKESTMYQILLFLSLLHYFKYLLFVWFIISCAFA
jgi:hypothetical protein